MTTHNQMKEETLKRNISKLTNEHPEIINKYGKEKDEIIKNIFTKKQL
jgi:hypothetical protein